MTTVEIESHLLMICVSIGRTRHKMVVAEHRALADRGAELVELRLDWLSRQPDLGRLLGDRPTPCVVTCRRRSDRGRWAGTENQRLALLRAAIVAGAEYVDLEDDIAGGIPRYGSTKRIVSHHNFDETPENLEEIHSQLTQYDPDLVKLVTMANSPGDMVRMQAGGAEISDDEIAGVVYSVLFAGHETTTTLLANAMREVLLNPDRWEDLKANPDKWTAATEEFLRFSPSIVAWRRRALENAEIGGVAIPKGANILLLLGSANRDDTVFENADTLDIDRPNARNHLSFGYGIHFCLGQQLSKLEFGIAMRELARRLPSLRLAPGQDFTFAHNTSFRVPTALQIEWDL